MKTPLLMMKPTGYKNSKIYSQLPSDGSGDFSYTRSLSGSRVASTGIIQQIASGTPRLDYRTETLYRNILDYSEEVQGAYSNWTLGRMEAEEIKIEPPVPSISKVIRYKATDVNGSHYVSSSFNDFTFEDNTNYCYSFYIKADTGKRVGISFKDQNNSFSTGVFDLDSETWILNAGNGRGYEKLDDGWFRVWQYDTSSSGATVPSCAFYLYDEAGNLNHYDPSIQLYVTGIQFEKGTAPTDYQPKENVPQSKTHYYEIASCPSLLLEENHANLFLRSEQIGGTSWTLAGATVNADNLTSPDGTTNADEIVVDTSTGTHSVRQYVSTFANATSYTFSIFAKKGTSTSWIRLYSFTSYADFNLDTYEIGANVNCDDVQISDYGDGWRRCSITFTSSNTFANSYIYINDSSNSNNYTGVNESVYLWGAQIEPCKVPSSYIKTEASSVTRGEDYFYSPNDSFNVSHNTGFTFYAEVEEVERFKDVINDYFQLLLYNRDESLSYCRFRWDTNNRIYFQVRDVAGASTVLSLHDAGVSQREDLGKNIKLAGAIDSEGNAYFYANGQEVATGTLTGFDWYYNKMRNSTSNFDVPQRLKDVRVYGEALTTAELTELTTL